MDATESSVPSDGRDGADTGADPAASARQMASTAGDVVKQEAANFASAVQAKVEATAGEQTKTASKAIGDFASAIQHAGDELAGKDQTKLLRPPRLHRADARATGRPPPA